MTTDHLWAILLWGFAFGGIAILACWLFALLVQWWMARRWHRKADKAWTSGVRDDD